MNGSATNRVRVEPGGHGVVAHVGLHALGSVADSLGFESALSSRIEYSVIATLKTEFYDRRGWPTKRGARLAVGACIEDRYNRRRRHASLGQVSTVNFEMQYLTNTAAPKKAA